MRHRYDYTQSLFLFRARVAELFVVALVFAIGARVIVSGFVMPRGSRTWLGWTPSSLTLVGSLLILSSMVFIISREWRMPPKDVNFLGMIIVEPERNKFLRVPRYDLSEKMDLYISGLSENKALMSIWESDSLSSCVRPAKERIISGGELTAAKLVREAIEYFFLQELSLHLNSHFARRNGTSEREVEVFEREDIPSILLQNHFLELFSKPMAEREAFSGSTNRDSGKVVSVWTSSGKMFEHFELILPMKTKVTRINDDSILINTKRFEMRISSNFDGSGYAFPGFYHFWSLYLRKDIMDARAYAVNLRVEIRMKPLSMFTLTGWDHYRWLDSFLDRLNSAFSVEGFLEDIGWNTACTVGQIMESEKSKSPSNSGVPKEHVIEIMKVSPD